jgi:hypothetical protein
MGRTCGVYGHRRCAYRLLVGRPMEGDYSRYLGIDGRIALKWISRSWMGHGLN